MLPSCVTYKKCLQKFPPTTDTIKVVERRDSVIFRDTTIMITLPGKTVVDSIFIPCPEFPPTFVPDTVFASTELAESFAYVNRNGVLRLYLTQRDTTITLRLEKALREAYFWRNEYEKVTVTPHPIKFVPKIYKVFMWIVIGELIALLIFLLIRLK